MDIFPGFSVYLSNLLTLVLLLAAFWSAGHGVTGIVFKAYHSTPDKTLTDHIFALVIGVIVYLKSAFLLGLFGILNIYSLSFILIAGLLTFTLTMRRTRAFSCSDLNAGHLFVFAMCLILGMRSLFLLVGADEFSYHLPYARSFMEEQSLTVLEHLIYPFHTLEINLLYAIGLMIDDEYFLRLLSISFICLTLMLIYDYLQRRTTPWLALIAPLTVFSLAKIQDLALPIYVDFAFTFFVSVASVAFLQWLDNRGNIQERFYLVMAALAVAEAASTKYFGLAFGFILFLFILVHSQNKSKDGLLYLAICAVFGSAWYLRNIYLAGNPVHPFLSNIFGYYIWNKEDLALNLAELKSHGQVVSPVHYVTEIIRVGLFPVLFVYFGLVTYCYQKIRKTAHRNSRTLIAVSLICITYSVFWYYSAHIDRYLLPILGLSLIAFTLALDSVLPGRLPLIISRGFIGILCLFQLCFTGYKNWQLVNLYPYEGQDKFMREKIPGYAVLKYANEMAFENKRIFQIRFATRAYYYEGVAAGHWMGAARWSAVMNTADWQSILYPAKQIRDYIDENDYAALALAKTTTYDIEDLLTEFNSAYEDEYGFLLVPKESKK